VSKLYPWYDSGWLSVYVLAREFIRRNHPQKLNDFVHAFDVFRTDPGYSIKELPQLFDEATIEDLRTVIKEQDLKTVSKFEIEHFGRFVVRDIPYVSKLQQRITDLVSERVGEPVEPCYNFLSLYWELGVCDVHMDAPFAKWTVDFCIEQSTTWPIHFSKIVPWPEDWTDAGDDWQDTIKDDPANRFASYEMQEGEAIIFSGSSQWHYRNPIERKVNANFCHLLFFHFIPAGTSELTLPANWKDLFGIPDLAGLENPTDYPLVAFNELPVPGTT